MSSSVAVTLYPEVKLPSGRVIIYRSMSFRDRKSLLLKYKGQEGYLAEELFASFCLVSDNNQPVASDWEIGGDWTRRMDHWSVRDVMFYSQVFLDTELLEDSLMKNAKDMAKKLLGGLENPTPMSFPEDTQQHGHTESSIQQEPTPSRRANLKINVPGS